MKDIFTDLYKKVVGFFQSSEKEKQENAKDVACNRLKLVLMQDRTNLNPYLLERMRSEMIDVLSKYVEMDKEALELNFAQEGESMALMLSIPVLRAKEEDEIQAIIDAEEAKKQEKIAEDESDAETDEDAESKETEEGEVAAEDATETVDAESEEGDGIAEVCGCSEENELSEEPVDGCSCGSEGCCGCGESEEVIEEVNEKQGKKTKKK